MTLAGFIDQFGIAIGMLVMGAGLIAEIWRGTPDARRPDVRERGPATPKPSAKAGGGR